MTESLPYSIKKKHILATEDISPIMSDQFDDQVQAKRKYQKKSRTRSVKNLDLVSHQCPECSSLEIIVDEVSGDQICTSCGMVLDAHVILSDKGGISFSQADDDDFSRASGPVYRMTPTSEKLAKKIQQAEKWTHTWSEIHQVIVKKEINRYLYELDLPSFVADNANNLYQKAYKKNAIQGRGIKAMAAACVYISCREHQIPIFFKDIEAVSKQEHTTIRKCFTYLMENFHIRLPVVDSRYFIPQLVTKLGFSELMVKVATRILDRLESGNWGEQINNPKHMAAISVYFAYNIMQKAEKLEMMITQKDFSQIVGMSETTLRKYRRMFQEAIAIKM